MAVMQQARAVHNGYMHTVQGSAVKRAPRVSEDVDPGVGVSSGTPKEAKPAGRSTKRAKKSPEPLAEDKAGDKVTAHRMLIHWWHHRMNALKLS